MDKFKAAVMKMISSNDPKTPLTPTQMAILDDRLTHVFSQLRTPNHPPYSAMIQRALQELNQKGGSSEESISQFIKKEYVDLPWAHLTLLKHHLGLLCESGEIVGRGSHYSLAVVSSGPGSVRCQRKHRKRRQRRDWLRRQSKRHKTSKEKLQIEDEIGAVKELEEVDDQQNQVQGNENKRENGQVEGIEQPKQEGVASTELLQFCDGVGNSISSKPRTLIVEHPLSTIKDAYHTKVGVQQGDKCEPRIVDMTDISDPYLECLQESNPIGDDMIEHCEERPPGFESMRMEKSSNHQECSTQDLHVEKISDLLVATKTELCATPTNLEQHPLSNGHVEDILTSNVITTYFEQKLKLSDGCDQPKQHESQPQNAIPIDIQAESLEREQEQQIKTNDSLEALHADEILQTQQLRITATHGPLDSDQNLHGKQPVTLRTTDSINMKQAEPGEHPALSNLGEGGEICGWKEQMQFESTSDTGSPLYDNHKQEEHREAKKPCNGGETEIFKQSCSSQQVKMQQQQKMNEQHQGKKHVREQVKYGTAVLALPHQQKEYQLLDTEQIKETPPLLVNPLKSQQQHKQYYRKKRRRQEKEMKTEHVTLDMDQTTNEHLTEYSNLKESRSLKHALVESLSKGREESCVTQKESELQSETTKACSKTWKDPEQLNQDVQSVPSDMEKVLGLESVGDEESPQTQRMQRQLRRWSKKLPEPSPTKELLPSSGLSEKDTLVEMLSGKPQEQEQMPSELSPVTSQRAKLRSWKKQNRAQPQETEACLCLSVDFPQKLTNNHICLERSPEPEIQNVQPQLKTTPLEQGKQSPMVLHLRSRPHKPESVCSVELNHMSLENQCKEQQQEECLGQGRPIKSKPDATRKKLVFSEIQYEERQHTVNQGRGRPLNSSATVDKLFSESLYDGQHTGYQHIGMACKAKSDTIILRESIYLIHQNDHDTVRPLKAKEDRVLIKESAAPEYKDKYMQKREEKQGHCMPSEENAEATTMKTLPLSNNMHNPKQKKQLKQLKNIRGGRPSRQKLNIDTGKNNASSSERRLRKSSRGRAQKTD